MAKPRGKEKSADSDVPAEVEAADGGDVNAEPTPSEPVKMDVAIGTTVDESEEVKEVEAEEEEAEEVKEDGTVETEIVTVITENEKMDEGDTKEEVKGEEKVIGASSKKARRWAKKKAADASAAASNDTNKPETTSAEKKAMNKADGMGLVFMCNAKTKKDCFQYSVLGLPENKRKIVEKVYKGMRLFLYDIDLKLMYGIYKAACPGGYNLEPKAFKSGYPCQVRFTVLNDCTPLPEERFKAAIKSNYYGKNKFNIQLSPEQVKNLCKLFMSASKGGSKQNLATGPSKTPVSIGRERKGRPPPPARQHPAYPRGGGHIVRPREALYASPPPPRPFMPPPPPYYAYDRPTYDRPTYDRPTYDRPTYDRPAYDRPVEDYYHHYRREPPRPVEYHEPYSLYREPAPAPYWEAAYPVGVPSPAYPPPPQYRY